MAARKPGSVKAARNPNLRGKKSKWEKARKARALKRKAQKKKPLVEPLTIAPWQERQAALKEGKMLFYDGNKKISLKMITLRGSGKRRTFFRINLSISPPASNSLTISFSNERFL